MMAAALLEELRAAGLMLDLAPDGLRVSPKERLTDDLRQKIRANKAGLLAALRLPPDDRDTLAGDAASQLATVEVMALAAHPDRTVFALRNHAEAIRHFRQAAADTERLAVMYRQKVVDHIEAARRHIPQEEFDAWLRSCR